MVIVMGVAFCLTYLAGYSTGKQAARDKIHKALTGKRKGRR